MIYLDNAATTPLCEEAEEAIIRSLREGFLNPSSLYTDANMSRDFIAGTRKNLADLIGASPEEIYFTSGATESINTVLRGVWEAYPNMPRKLVTTKTEHMAVLNLAGRLEEEGVEVIYLKTKLDGSFYKEELISALKEKPGLVFMAHVNNESGAVIDIAEIASLIKEISPRTKFGLDIAQSLSKFAINTKDLAVDYMAASGHKMHAPKGIGLLYVRKNVLLRSLIVGGDQEAGLRSGTENLPGIAGFGGAAKAALQGDLEQVFQRVTGLKAALLQGLDRAGVDYHLNSPVDASPYIVNLSIPGHRPEVVLHYLASRGILISTASACSSKKKRSSHVLEAMGLESKYVDSALRISFSGNTTPDQVEKAVEAISEFVKTF